MAVTGEVPTGRWRHVGRRWFGKTILVLQIEVLERREYLRGGGLDISEVAAWRDAEIDDLTVALSPSPTVLQPEKMPEKSPAETQMKRRSCSEPPEMPFDPGPWQ